ncbi:MULTISPECIES: FtsH protease activity modulator HflK [Aeromonas]|uniref:Protein HflK n=2 Tax=Aeromonas enteropelogenes TaxID=29489 RepID=A0A175VEG7_AEREN|nr:MULTISPECIES: FtsH protease activity modulator HflK [Aeromonas]KXU78993.1 protease modulator HflK [Aeromonas enteropelogenes]MCZ0752911.1 FtsH protease activity modulator HflK [Aeromonas enteropelogenes]QXC34225.1 FtsH protease activity modulator HflK [Aeromonas sp. FDAARGOS 1407]RQM64588.1 FtsH protease activity modulator HflK [Aeromonas enteropelogenes]UBH28819.1 FtsH protease activity modulator HflK [Aeromonas enteropelogenes]
MAWNEPGNNGKDRDPWGNNGKNQGPPDLDEMLRKVSRRFGGLLGGGKSGGDVGRFGISIALVVAVVVWVVSGFYTIREAERGAVLRFGKFSHIVEPGLRWKPTFIDQVIPVDVESVRSLPASGFMLTQDENVVRVEMDVQYRVVNPEQYLFSVTNADESLSQATDSALRYVVGHTKMDDVLTTGREKVRQETWEVIDGIIEPYQMGLQIVDVNFLPARPPEEVKDAFDDAIAAQEDEQRFIREAEAYAREVEPKARGQVKRLEQEAEAYKSQIVLKAQGEVARFNELLPQYQAAPELTRNRIYLETMEELYQQANKVLVDMPAGNNSMIYLPLDKLSGKPNVAQPQRSTVAPTVEPAPVSNEGANSTPMPLRSGDRFSSGRN